MVRTFGLTHITPAVQDAERAFRFCRDPDRYEIEIWHELPTPVDPGQSAG